MNSTLITITDKARAILAFEQELMTLEGHIRMENDRHLKQIATLTHKQQSLEEAILRLMPN